MFDIRLLMSANVRLSCRFGEKDTRETLHSIQILLRQWECQSNLNIMLTSGRKPTSRTLCVSSPVVGAKRRAKSGSCIFHSLPWVSKMVALFYLFFFFCELAWGPHSSGRCWVQGIREKQAAADMKSARPTSYSIRMKGVHLKSGATGMFFAFANSRRVEERELLGRPQPRQNRKVWEGAVALFRYVGGAQYHGARHSCHTDRCTCGTSPKITGYSVFIDANKCGLFST